MSLNQAYILYIFILTGILVGLLFDIFRVFRKSFKTSDFITIVEDVVFFILSSLLIIYTVFKFNNGELRSFVLMGIISGITIYLKVFSKTFIKVNVNIIESLKKIMKATFSIIIYPIKCLSKILKKIIVKPVFFVFINLRKNINSLSKNMSKHFRNCIIVQKKVKKTPN